ncbi:hypothetical protein QOT17_009585 [Balamuthia mandrillaris]
MKEKSKRKDKKAAAGEEGERKGIRSRSSSKGKSGDSSKKKRSSSSKPKKEGGGDANNNNKSLPVTLRYEIVLKGLDRLRRDCNGANFWVAWKRGKKGSNKGKTKSVVAQYNSVEWDQVIAMKSTLLKYPEENRFEPKFIDLTVYKQESGKGGKKEAWASVSFDLAKYARPPASSPSSSSEPSPWSPAENVEFPLLEASKDDTSKKKKRSSNKKESEGETATPAVAKPVGGNMLLTIKSRWLKYDGKLLVVKQQQQAATTSSHATVDIGGVAYQLHTDAEISDGEDDTTLGDETETQSDFDTDDDEDGSDFSDVDEVNDSRSGAEPLSSDRESGIGSQISSSSRHWDSDASSHTEGSSRPAVVEAEEEEEEEKTTDREKGWKAANKPHKSSSKRGAIPTWENGDDKAHSGRDDDRRHSKDRSGDRDSDKSEKSKQKHKKNEKKSDEEDGHDKTAKLQKKLSKIEAENEELKTQLRKANETSQIRLENISSLKRDISELKRQLAGGGSSSSSNGSDDSHLLGDGIAVELLASLKGNYRKNTESSQHCCYWLGFACSLLDMLCKVALSDDGVPASFTKKLPDISIDGIDLENVIDITGKAAKSMPTCIRLIGTLQLLIKDMYSLLITAFSRELESLFLPNILQQPTGALEKLELIVPRNTTLQGERKVKFRSFTWKLTEMHDQMRYNSFSPAIERQFFLQIFYFINCRLFNALLKQSELCTCGFGFKLKYAISELKTWLVNCGITSNKSDNAIASQLDHIYEAANVLVLGKSFFEDDSVDLGQVFTSLNIWQIKHLLNSFSSDQVSSEGISVAVKRKVEEACSAAGPPPPSLFLDFSSPSSSSPASSSTKKQRGHRK